MQGNKKTIHIVDHKPTGARIPIEILEVDKNNHIVRHKEWTPERKAFTLKMLMTRWSKSKEEVIQTLYDYEIPAHIRHPDVQKLAGEEKPIDCAYFFEEYAYGLEKKINLSHCKIKAKHLPEKAK